MPKPYTGTTKRRGVAATKNKQRAKASTVSPSVPFTRRLPAWIKQHVLCLTHSLRRLLHKPMASFLTITVIAIALALPTAMQQIVDVLSGLGENLRTSARISLFLDISVSDQKAEALAIRLRQRASISHTETISRKEALAEFKTLSGFTTALDVLSENPLPAIIVIEPQLEHLNSLQLKQLVHDLESLPEVASAQLDHLWIERLHAILSIGERANLIIGVLLALAVIVMIGNTMRLEIQSRRREIEVHKLIGATDAYIRRPFLYGGLWYGLLGACTAWLVLTISIVMLGTPLYTLAGSYGLSVNELRGQMPTTMLLAGGALLGWLGAWLAVGRHLQDFEPS